MKIEILTLLQDTEGTWGTLSEINTAQLCKTCVQLAPLV